MLPVHPVIHPVLLNMVSEYPYVLQLKFSIAISLLAFPLLDHDDNFW